MEHYVVILDWCTESEGSVDIIGVAHSMDEAKEIFNKQLENEKYITAKNEWHVFEDLADYYEAWEFGCYDDGHTKLWIQGVN